MPPIFIIKISFFITSSVTYQTITYVLSISKITLQLYSEICHGLQKQITVSHKAEEWKYSVMNQGTNDYDTGNSGSFGHFKDNNKEWASWKNLK